MGKNLKIENIIPDHIESLVLKLKEMGVNMIEGDDYICVSKTDMLRPVNIRTLGYPGFPTDLQQPLTALLLTCNGISNLNETIYENRFQNIPYLNNMGAHIELIDNRNIKIIGPSKLIGTEVTATDLRAGACMVLAGLSADGKTTINNIEHVLRGYENIVEKLNKVGAKIVIKEI